MPQRKYVIHSSKVKRGREGKTKHRKKQKEKEASVGSRVTPIQRGSVLHNRHYTTVCVHLENKLYSTFMAHRNQEDVDKKMLLSLQHYSDRYLTKKAWQDIGFAILIYGSDILSHYGTWDTAKMGTHLKAISRKVTQADSLHSSYFKAAILQALCYQAVLKGKYGRANDYINKAFECIQFLEPCEWTSWVYQMYGMISWNLTEVFESLADDLFNKAGRAFLMCRDHNLEPYAKAGFHAKYCGIWALLRTAKVKAKLPWNYDLQTMERFLQNFCVSQEDQRDIEKLIQKAKEDNCELKQLSLYHENIKAEIMELQLFAEYRRYQSLFQYRKCKVCQLQHLNKCCEMYMKLLDCWEFTDDHRQGLGVLYKILQQQKGLCSCTDIHTNGCPYEDYESDVI